MQGDINSNRNGLNNWIKKEIFEKFANKLKEEILKELEVNNSEHHEHRKINEMLETANLIESNAKIEKMEEAVVLVGYDARRICPSHMAELYKQTITVITGVLSFIQNLFKSNSPIDYSG